MIAHASAYEDGMREVRMEGGKEGQGDKEGREKFSYIKNQQYTFLGFLLYLYTYFTEQYGTV